MPSIFIGIVPSIIIGIVRYKTIKREDVIMPDENEKRPVESLSEPWQGDVEDHLAKAIISACVCCVPFGIVAIVHATRVNPALRAGDPEGAREASAKANFWGNLSIITGIVVIIIVAFAIQPLMESTVATRASAKAEMANAVLALESFESAHSSQVKKSGGLNFTAKDLLCDSSFQAPMMKGEYFTYAIVTNKQGNPIALHATSKVPLGQFNGTLITRYNEEKGGTYNHSVDPEYMQRSAERLVPQFFQTD